MVVIIIMPYSSSASLTLCSCKLNIGGAQANDTEHGQVHVELLEATPFDSAPSYSRPRAIPSDPVVSMSPSNLPSISQKAASCIQRESTSSAQDQEDVSGIIRRTHLQANITSAKILLTHWLAHHLASYGA
eukprot:gnl/MRDRNA2_/MRDRNA2_42352_c0_seq1.p1 gnl/MRDRNA2_/MRDRNA2_42352_c0~~gnl/MRDRNA2_/MRDRNA2_42352_c0_seq1.p1  ORF type:complete len:131 (-),score=10.90 gnl/MRDRNA2_/MRDRNA2_42352_c0_seq1:133-525(-)